MPSTQWAIASGKTLYYGTASSKRLAIAQHVWAFDKGLYERGWPHSQSGPLDRVQKAVWKSCRERGDRAVKVHVTEIA